MTPSFRKKFKIIFLLSICFSYTHRGPLKRLWFIMMFNTFSFLKVRSNTCCISYVSASPLCLCIQTGIMTTYLVSNTTIIYCLNCRNVTWYNNQLFIDNNFSQFIPTHSIIHRSPYATKKAQGHSFGHLYPKPNYRRLSLG